MNIQSAYGNNNILQLNQMKYNGRVNVLEPDPKTQFKMMERSAKLNKAVSYCDALKGTWEDSSLSQAFFSKENMQIIQNAIRAEIYRLSGNKYIIVPPSVDHLRIIMRSTFLSYAEFYDEKITKQISYLNKIVLDYCVPELFSASTAHVNYLQDQSSLVVPLRLPLNHDRNYKQLELKPWV